MLACGTDLQGRKWRAFVPLSQPGAKAVAHRFGILTTLRQSVRTTFIGQSLDTSTLG
jgi:hypothetical protein